MGDPDPDPPSRYLTRTETGGGNQEMLLLMIVAGWIALSIPIALVVGLAIRRGQRAIPAHVVELAGRESTRLDVLTRKV